MLPVFSQLFELFRRLLLEQNQQYLLDVCGRRRLPLAYQRVRSVPRGLPLVREPHIGVHLVQNRVLLIFIFSFLMCRLQLRRGLSERERLKVLQLRGGLSLVRRFFFCMHELCPGSLVLPH